MDIKIPEDCWEEDAEGVISSWLYTGGDAVEAGAVIAEIMVEKVMHEIEAPTDGTLVHLIAEEETVSKGAVIGRVD